MQLRGEHGGSQRTIPSEHDYMLCRMTLNIALNSREGARVLPRLGTTELQ